MHELRNIIYRKSFKGSYDKLRSRWVLKIKDRSEVLLHSFKGFLESPKP